MVKKMKLKKLILLLIIVLAMGLVACKDNNGNNPVDPSSNNTGQEEETPISAIKLGEEDLFNSYLVLFGRTYFSKGRLALDHCGTGFEVKFKGTSLTLEITASPTTVLTHVFIDGVIDNSLMITRNGTYKIAKELEDKEHTVRFIKASSTASEPIFISEISTDGQILKHPNDYKLSIEFVGDSITAGAGVLSTSDNPTTSFSNNDCTKAYSYVCADILGAYVTMSATEGICVKVDEALPNSIDLYQWYSLNYRFKYEAKRENDIVVIDLGTNDSDYLARTPSYKDQFYSDYLELVNLIREKNPNAQIICIYGHMWTNDTIRSAIRKVVSDLNSNGDEKIHYFQVSSDLTGAGYHPGLEGAKRQGTELANYIMNNNIVDASLINKKEEKPYIDGKKLVVFGDSITALGTWGKTTADELNMYFYNGAMGGITSAQGIDRFNAVVRSSGADFVTLCFGQNDLIMNTYNTPKVSLADFKTNMTQLVEMVREIGAVPILLTTNPLNPDVFWTAQGQNKDNYTEVGGDPLAWLDEYNRVTREVASETGCDLVDMRNEFSEKYYRNALSDGIHLNARGNEIFASALLNYFKARFDNDPNADRVGEEDLNVYVDGAEHVDIISMDASSWYTLDSTLMKIESEEGFIKFYNTNGLWPDAQYTPTNPIVVDYNSGVIYYDLVLGRVDTSILIFINGSTPSAYRNGEYYVINAKISDNVNAAGDLCGPGEFKGSIKLTDLAIPKAYQQDGNIVITGIKVFVAGTSYQTVTINELSVAIEE